MTKEHKMSIYYGCEDADYYVDLHWGITSQGTERCIECRRLIHPGEEHYHVEEWKPEYEHPYGTAWDSDHVQIGQHACCEACGDLALAFMALGYCWSYGDLRDDIRMMQE